MVDVQLKTITKGEDEGKQKAFIKINVPVKDTDGKITGNEEFEYDLRTIDGINDYLSQIFAGSSITDEKNRMLFTPILRAMKEQRNPLMN